MLESAGGGACPVPLRVTVSVRVPSRVRVCGHMPVRPERACVSISAGVCVCVCGWVCVRVCVCVCLHGVANTCKHSSSVKFTFWNDYTFCHFASQMHTLTLGSIMQTMYCLQYLDILKYV